MMDTLDEWCKEYGIERTAIEVMNAWISQQTIGITYFKRSVLPGQERWAEIVVTDLFRKGTLAYNTTLWHEFCHAEKWIKDGTTDGHGSEWMRRLWRKPFLFIADITYTKLMFWHLLLIR